MRCAPRGVSCRASGMDFARSLNTFKAPKKKGEKGSTGVRGRDDAVASGGGGGGSGGGGGGGGGGAGGGGGGTSAAEGALLCAIGFVLLRYATLVRRPGHAWCGRVERQTTLWKTIDIIVRAKRSMHWDGCVLSF